MSKVKKKEPVFPAQMYVTRTNEDDVSHYFCAFETLEGAADDNPAAVAVYALVRAGQAVRETTFHAEEE